MLFPLLLTLLPLSASATGVEKTLGVAPSDLAKYAPTKDSRWKCLDGSKVISWDAVNDDYCDCADGSDEPGTSACSNGSFYCRNEGHIGSRIHSSRVNDGLCEPECCDGSDEPTGLCANNCKLFGEAHKEKRDAERKTQKTGSKIRSTYIAFAHKEKKRLEDLVISTEEEITTREKEVERLRAVTERTESVSAAALEHKKQSPLYLSLVEHSMALKSLQREHKKHIEREKALGDILNALRSGYNPNYQDMAVLEAVRGWEFHAKLPHINDVKKDVASDSAVVKTDEEVTEELEEGTWTAEQLENNLDNLVNTDHVSLLMEHDEHVSAPTEGSVLFDIPMYLPDPFLPAYLEIKDAILGWLQALRIISRASDSSADATKSRQALSDAEHSLNLVKDEKKKAEEELGDLFAIEGFGEDGQFKKLDGMCLETDSGEYTYEVCMFDEARQKPKNGGSTFSLGKFSSWNPKESVEAGSPEYYSKQIYNKGAQCWNGPERSVILVMTCGTENKIDSVMELEKCEYQFTGTTPALCLPLDESDKSREEL